MKTIDTVAVRGAVFDCDGTLLDTMPLWRALEAELAARAGHVLTAAQKDLLCTCTVEESSRFFYGELGLGEGPDDVARMIDELGVEYYRTRACARPGAREFVERLVAAGVRCAVASSSPHSMLDCGLVCAGLAPYIDAVVSTDDVGASKRTPAAYDRARELLGTPRSATWVFEDASYALKCARDAGYPCVGVWDCDESGSFDELGRLSDVAARDWRELDVEAFLAGDLGLQSGRTRA